MRTSICGLESYGKANPPHPMQSFLYSLTIITHLLANCTYSVRTLVYIIICSVDIFANRLNMAIFLF